MKHIAVTVAILVMVTAVLGQQTVGAYGKKGVQLLAAYNLGTDFPRSHSIALGTNYSYWGDLYGHIFSFDRKKFRLTATTSTIFSQINSICVRGPSVYVAGGNNVYGAGILQLSINPNGTLTQTKVVYSDLPENVVMTDPTRTIVSYFDTEMAQDGDALYVNEVVQGGAVAELGLNLTPTGQTYDGNYNSVAVYDRSTGQFIGSFPTPIANQPVRLFAQGGMLVVTSTHDGVGPVDVYSSGVFVTRINQPWAMCACTTPAGTIVIGGEDSVIGFYSTRVQLAGINLGQAVGNTGNGAIQIRTVLFDDDQNVLLAASSPDTTAGATAGPNAFFIRVGGGLQTSSTPTCPAKTTYSMAPSAPISQ